MSDKDRPRFDFRDEGWDQRRSQANEAANFVFGEIAKGNCDEALAKAEGLLGGLLSAYQSPLPFIFSELDEPVARLFVAKGEALECLNQKPKAREVYIQLIQRFKNSTDIAVQAQVAAARWYRARCLMDEGDIDKAATRFRQTMSLYEDATEPRLQIIGLRSAMSLAECEDTTKDMARLVAAVTDMERWILKLAGSQDEEIRSFRDLAVTILARWETRRELGPYESE